MTDSVDRRHGADDRRARRRGGRRITDLVTHIEAHITIGQFADHLAVAPKTVRKWIDAGVLPAYQFEGQWRIARVDAVAFVQRSRFPPPR